MLKHILIFINDDSYGYQTRTTVHTFQTGNRKSVDQYESYLFIYVDISYLNGF